jgi:hypothetical protein
VTYIEVGSVEDSKKVLVHVCASVNEAKCVVAVLATEAGEGSDVNRIKGSKDVAGACYAWK